MLTQLLGDWLQLKLSASSLLHVSFGAIEILLDTGLGGFNQARASCPYSLLVLVVSGRVSRLIARRIQRYFLVPLAAPSCIHALLLGHFTRQIRLERWR